MDSFEKEVKDKFDESNQLPEKIDISMAKYFWQANPLVGRKEDSIPKYLRKVNVLKNFSDNELRVLSTFMHTRDFSDKEVIFKQTDLGMGFYFIFSGMVDVIVEDEGSKDSNSDLILTLEKYDYFGELALLQENSVRNATVISREGCQLLGIFKPDLDHLIHSDPVVATKLLQSVSVIIANRLFSLTKEVRELKFKISQLGCTSVK
ncbi:MAG: cyclic nucleotide-binding domain-containing protein [Halobacteriovoraceae bacterium]|jgi:CRP/FNR family transcriptional regulator, cyclic AMP receptor protein|nr:cyclic nucleotide-binding domain-containing protein [Halobacteriovoraceae bacterium]MBT5095918.1 cyclic nucleotide-binding domain-containing protein [Halobacteriovoraceae bacterium]